MIAVDLLKHAATSAIHLSIKSPGSTIARSKYDSGFSSGGDHISYEFLEGSLHHPLLLDSCESMTGIVSDITFITFKHVHQSVNIHCGNK